MVDSYLSTKFVINLFDGIWENAFYGRATDARATALALLTQSSRANKMSDKARYPGNATWRLLSWKKCTEWPQMTLTSSKVKNTNMLICLLHTPPRTNFSPVSLSLYSGQFRVAAQYWENCKWPQNTKVRMWIVPVGTSLRPQFLSVFLCDEPFSRKLGFLISPLRTM